MLVKEGAIYNVLQEIHQKHPNLRLGNASYSCEKIQGVRTLAVRTSLCEFSMPVDREMERETLIEMIIKRCKEALVAEANRLEVKAGQLRSIANGTHPTSRI